ncbi:MAG: TSUP family transporter [Candidatus Limnocylindria bacterium]
MSRQPVLGVVGLAAGVLSGLLGIGGGVVMVPALVLLVGAGQHRAEAVSLAAIVPIAAVSATLFSSADSVDPSAAALLAVGGLVGVRAGARLMYRLDEAWLARTFSAFLLAVAISMLLR